MVATLKSARLRSTLRAWLIGLLLFLYTTWGEPHETLPVKACILLVICAWWGWKVVRRRGLARSPVSLPLAGLIAAAVISALFSVAPRLSVMSTLRPLSLLLFFFLTCDLLLSGWAPGTLASAILVHAGLIIAYGLVYVAVWYLGWWQLRVPEYPPFLLPYRLFGPAEHPNLLAAVIYLALPLAIVRLGLARRPAQRLLYALWLAAAEVVLFYTRSRGGWAATSVGVAVTVGWLLWQRRPAQLADARTWVRNNWRLGVMVVGYLAVLAALLVFDSRASTSEFSSSGGSVSELAGRPAFWRTAWDAFLAHPLTGSGIGTFPYVDTEANGATTGWVTPHAHNLFFNILAEEGIVGLLALGWASIAAASALYRGWRLAAKSPDALPRQALLVAVAAALLASLVHAVADIPYILPSNALVVLLLLAVGLQAAGALSPGHEGLSRRRVLALIAPIALACVLVRLNAGRAALGRGVAAAGQGEWRAAAQELDQAVALDPGLSFYQAQRGYAYGVVATHSPGDIDRSALAQSLAAYAAARSAGPQYAPDLLNTAWLLEQEGAPTQAADTLAAAADRGSWWLPSLLLANHYTAEGRLDEAEKLYAEVLKQSPAVAETAACRQSAGCREAVERMPAQPNPVAEVHDAAIALLAEARPEEALAVLRRVPLTNRNALPWLDRVDAHIMLGQLPQARYAMTIANTLGGQEARAALSRARLSLAEGSVDDAIAALERVARPQSDYVSYDTQVFGRVGLPGTLLPGLDLLQRTPDDLAVYGELARLYAQAGRVEDAAWAQAQADTLAGLLGEPGQTAN